MNHRAKLNELLKLGREKHHTPEAKNFAVMGSIAHSLAAIADVAEWYLLSEPKERRVDDE